MFYVWWGLGWVALGVPVAWLFAYVVRVIRERELDRYYQAKDDFERWFK